MYQLSFFGEHVDLCPEERKRRQKTGLSDSDRRFCQIFFCEQSMTGSLRAWEKAYRSTNKVRASDKLSNPEIWIDGLERMKALINKTEYTKNICNLAEGYEERNGENVIRAYIRIIEEGDRHNTPVENVGLLMELYQFFEVLNRGKFMYEVQEKLREEKDILVQLTQANPIWKREWRAKAKYLKDIGINASVTAVLKQKINLN